MIMGRDWQRYDQHLLGFSLSYPPGWEVIPGGLGAAVLLLGPIDEPVPFRPNLVATLHPLPEGGLDAFVADQKERSATVLTDFTVIEEDDASFTATYRQGRQTIGLAQWNVPWVERVVSVSAAAEAGAMAELRSTFETIGASLEFGKVATDG